MEPIYLHDWSDPDWKGNVGREALMNSFEIGEGEMGGVEILLASYTYENYEGDAFVLFRRDGKLYEVNGGHCSCYGLEGQWKPEETTAADLLFRFDGSPNAYYRFRNELESLLTTLSLHPL
jgi:hypothetical protein